LSSPTRSSAAFIAGLPYDIPNGLAEDADGGLLAAYRGGAVYRIKGDKARVLTERDGLPTGTDMCALTTDNKGRVWFAKGGQAGLTTPVVLSNIITYKGFKQLVSGNWRQPFHPRTDAEWRACFACHGFQIDARPMGKAPFANVMFRLSIAPDASASPHQPLEIGPARISCGVPLNPAEGRSSG